MLHCSTVSGFSSTKIIRAIIIVLIIIIIGPTIIQIAPQRKSEEREEEQGWCAVSPTRVRDGSSHHLLLLSLSFDLEFEGSRSGL